MITLRSCPVCNCREIMEYHQIGLAPHVEHELMPGVTVSAAIISRYSQCRECHVIFQNPRMSERELNTFYSKGYYRRTINLTDEEKDADEMYRATVDAKIIKQHLGDVSSHLDIGCSRGYLLEQVGAASRVGVESDVDHVTASGIKVYSDIDDVSKKRFDLVTAIHVLEHVADPLTFLKRMVAVTNANGHLIIEVPTWKSPGGPLRLPHLFHFEPDVLRLMCREVGLNVEHTEFTPHLMLICRA